MLNRPLISSISQKASDFIHITLVIIMYIAVCAEADMYVPAFPQMIDYFKVAENQIQLILSINFAGLCIACLVCGPLSDAYGRRNILLGGLFVFVLSSLGCAITDNFQSMLFFRLLQGIAISAPMVIAGASFFDKYPAEKAGQLIGVINTFISVAMAGAPVVGAFIVEAFSWRANFQIILLLAIIIFAGVLLFTEETLPVKKRRAFSLTSICKDYFKLLKSFKFMAYCLIVNAPIIAIVVYIANLSIIFVNHFGMSLNEFAYYQATTMGTFIFFALFSVKLISIKGLDFTKNVGGILALIGTFMLYQIGVNAPQSVILICSAMALIAAGSALMAGTFGSKAMAVFPEMKGTALGLSSTIRQLLAAVLVIVSELMFDGTIVPITQIITALALVCLGAYMVVWYNEGRGKVGYRAKS